MTQNSEFSGKLTFLAVAGILKNLFQRKASGQLQCSSGTISKRIVFKNGLVIYSSSNYEKDRLGDVLLNRGIISRSQYEESIRQMTATGKKQGTVLVQMGALSPKELFQGLIFQVKEVALSVFEWEYGDYLFTGELPPQEEIVTLRINPAALIFEGAERVAALKAFRKIWRPGNMTFTVNPSSSFSMDDLSLPMEARKLLALLERNKPWKETPELIGRSESEVVAILWALRILDVVTAEDPAAAASSPAADPEKVEAPPPPAEKDSEEEREKNLEIQRQREKISSLYRKVESLNFYQVLNLTPAATTAQIKNSYIALAKEFHPDRYFQNDFDILHDQITTIFMKVNEAYSVLANPGTRAGYDREKLHHEANKEQTPRPDRDYSVASEQFRKGKKLLKAGDYVSAIESFRWAVNLSPQNPLFHTFLGVALTMTRKRLHEAEEHCKTAIALDYNNPQFYVNLGQVYRTGKLEQKARRQYEAALKLDPKHPGALNAMRELKSSRDPNEKGFLDKVFGK